ncbi:MAG: hypothetical protein QOE92_1835, partial [Chloroflexota bacterium]|nr:hypothetical protein [Chloroflexota bacterium]
MQALPGQPALPFLDPDFDVEAFRGGVTAAFYTIKRAWAAMDPAVCRHRMTEDLWARQAAAIEAIRLDGCRTVVEAIAVIDVEVVDSQTVGSEDQVMAVLDVSGADYIIHEGTREVVRGSTTPGTWRETWVLRRRRDGRAQARKCPECGSPLEVNEDGRCAFCDAAVPGVKAEWLVGDMSRVGPAGGAAEDPGVSWGRVGAALAEEVALHPWLGHDPSPPPVADAAVAG